MRARDARIGAIVLAGALLLAGCGGGGGDDDAGGPLGGGGSSTTAPTFDPGSGTPTTSSGSTSSGSPGGKVRIVNVLLGDDGQPAGPMDAYDTATPGRADRPLISDLGYGEVSDYVRPKGFGGSGQLYIFPAGKKAKSDDDSDWDGQAISNAGFDEGSQQTVVIGTTNFYGDPSGEQTQPSYQSLYEKGTKEYPVADAMLAKDGKGLILANAFGVGRSDKERTDQALRIDGECPKRDDPENSPGGSVETIANGNGVPFTVDPGAHDLAILSASDDAVPSTCDDPAWKVVETSVTVAAGKRVEVFAYGSGTRPDDVKVVTAPVD